MKLVLVKFQVLQSLKLAEFGRQAARQVGVAEINPGDAVVGVAGDVEPGAGVDERRVPALEHAAGVGEALAEGVEGVALGVGGGQGRRDEEEEEKRREDNC